MFTYNYLLIQKEKIMIEKKPFIMAIKNALKSGTFNYIGQEIK